MRYTKLWGGILLFFMSIFLNQLTAQKHTISGKVLDAENGELLIGATIAVNDGATGTTTNAYGFYSITLEQDSIKLQYNYIGLESKVVNFYLGKDTVIDIELGLPKDVDIEEVLVTANSNQERVNSTQMGVDEISSKELKEIPVVFGEADVLKVLQLKPGVQSGGEGTSGLFVRGGSADQNLFILDEAPVYNPNHLFGLFSTFNADATNNVKLYKAGFPADYGGKLSAVVDVRMREGNRKKFALEGGVGLISSRLMVEGPIQKNKASFLLSARRTYVDVFTELLNNANKDNEDWNQIPAYSFYDLNAKVNVDLSSKDKLYFSGYFGRDQFNFNSDLIKFGFNWGNAVATLRWNRMLSPKLFMNNALIFSDYIYNISNSFEDFSIDLGSGIRDINLKSAFNWSPHPDHAVKFGFNGIYHFFSVNRLNAGNGNDVNFEAGSNYKALELATYFADDWKISERFSLNYGLRLSGFFNEAFFYGIEPRLAMKYNVAEDVAIKASYTKMYQYIHLVSSSGASLPTDVWYPSNANIKPQGSDMVSVGTAWALLENYFISAELYYKWLDNQVDFRDGAQLFANDDLDNEFVFGKGDNYGFEVYLEKKNGWWRGWVGYTLSWSWRVFPDIMGGEQFPATSDRRHDISVITTVDIPKTPLTLTLAWIYGTGKAYSLPEQRIIVTDIVGENPFAFYPVYTKRNGFRIPAYHRMDLGLIYPLPLKKRFQSDITLSIYNLYNRYNVFSVFIEPVYAENSEDTPIQIPERFRARAISLFPIIPTLTWNFKF